MQNSNPPLDQDPFPNIPCALLQSADLHRYATSGNECDRLFQPFDEKGLKSASYEIPFNGMAYWWIPEKTGRIDQDLTKNPDLEIPKNSIVFIRPDVKFKIPDYLALRFNLHIKLVHRGLLLGTGPLVDPGFEGRLLIPVHNLTDEPLNVRANDGFIWVEVTKVSTLPSSTDGSAKYKKFPENKKNRDAWQYFDKANGGRPIRSSLPSLADKVESGLESMKEEIKLVKTWGFIGGAIASISIVISLYQLSEATKQMGESTKSLVQATQQMVTESVSKTHERLDKLESDLEKFNRNKTSKR
jgi:deoxycytidine triphosphate deaminase/cell division protein ZapA (FtsZ GTPase activity inhibitor)